MTPPVKRFFLFLLVFCSINCQNKLEGAKYLIAQKERIVDIPWEGHWITVADSVPEKNAWIAFRKQFKLERHSDQATFRIAVDSKYWLFLNGRPIVFEGGLKRGPTPEGTYYDELDLTGKLKKGTNTIAVLVWYFGKEGMSHKSSGAAGMVAELFSGNALGLKTDKSWKARLHPAFSPVSAAPHPNWRLPESNIVFDAQQDMPGWELPEFDDTLWPYTKVLAKGGDAPWNALTKRPIPFWKDYGLKTYDNPMVFPFESTGDTLACKLPYNAQVTPYLKVDAPGGQRITMLTDHYKGGSAYNMRAEYITKAGVQQYESPGWINGEVMYYVIPKGVTVMDLQYRETGYATEFEGFFECDDPFYDRLWQKSLRTLYVTMRDNYMDCPDRERAQWWGDVVLESGEAFYALDREADKLMKKGILELTAWQAPDSTLFAPVPAGNWNKELPTQMLSSIGTFGFWNYYWQTGDRTTMQKVYGAMGKYMAKWRLNEAGTLHLRKGGWTWGDWGENRDMPLLFNTQYYMALDSYGRIARLLGEKSVADSIENTMYQFKKDFNQSFWTGRAYRSKTYKGKTDDRSQALAVVSNLADTSTYEHIYKILQQEKHASPYMEKYILEALFQMDRPEFALQRMKERFGPMVNANTSTLWEGWGIGAEGYGGGTTNHAWSGGGLTLLSQYVAGVSPTSPGYDTFQVKPQLGPLKKVHAIVPSIKGPITVDIELSDTYQIKITVPKNTTATVCIPHRYGTILENGTKISFRPSVPYHEIEVVTGTYLFTAY